MFRGKNCIKQLGTHPRHSGQSCPIRRDFPQLEVEDWLKGNGMWRTSFEHHSCNPDICWRKL